MNDALGRTDKSIAIVGGGIAGLCAGCYAQMNGYGFRGGSMPGRSYP